MADMTVIILARNEAENIAGCIESVSSIASRIVVVDSYSDDETVELARGAGADVYQHEFVHYGRQFQWALDNCGIDTLWVFRLDADERVTAESRAEIESLTRLHADTDVNGFVFRLSNVFLGREIRHGILTTLEKLCIFKFGKAYMEDRYLGEHLVLTEGRSVSMRSLSRHNGARTVGYYVNKLNWYAAREAKDFLQRASEGQPMEELDAPTRRRRMLKYGIYYRLPSRLRCRLVFFYWYVIRLGFLDGREGFYWNYLTVYYYRTLIDALIYETQVTGKEIGETGALKSI